MSDVFISYKREDLAAVNRLVEALRAEGVGVWWDQDIPPNAPWEATIEKALAAAKLVIVAWSPAAVASDNVKAEARWARGQGRLLQVFVEPCDPPLFFGERQGVDLKGWSGGATDPAFRTLLQAVSTGPTPTSRETEGAAPVEPLPLPDKPSIAVMPFANLSGDPDQEYFADGMVEEITNALSRFKSLFVIASASTLSFKGNAVSPPEVGRQVGVRYVLDGSVRKAGNRVRISVKLIDAIDGAQIWADRFEDTLEDVFALQDKVALSVAGVIEPTIQTAEISRATARPTDNMGSYDLSLRALSHYRTLSKADMVAALDLFNRAIELDPEFGSALGFAIVCHGNIIVNGWSEAPQKDAQDAQALIQRAIKVARNDPEVLLNVAIGIMMTGGDRATAATFAERAVALNPGSSNVWFGIGMVRLQSGEPQLAFDCFETSLRLNPLSPYRPVFLGMEGMALFAQGRFADAIPLLRQSAELAPEWPFPTPVLAASYAHVGDTDAARSAIARHRMVSPVEARDTRWPESATEKLLIDGIAIAEGRAPMAGPSSG